MQSLTAAPRDALTDAQVRAVLLGTSGPVRTTRVGLDLLAPDLTVREDISSTLGPGKVARTLAAAIHGTCELTLSAPRAWLTDLVRPRLSVTVGGVETTWYAGVYSLATPRTVVRSVGSEFVVTGLDRLSLLDRFVGNTYVVAATAEVLAAVRAVVVAAGLPGSSLLLDSSAAGVQVGGTGRQWPLISTGTNGGSAGSATSTTWLGIANELLRLVGYRGLWCDELGQYRSGPYVEPATRRPEFTFDTGPATSIIAPERSVDTDVYVRWNQWIFVAKGNPAPSAGAGLYVVDDLDARAARGGLVYTAPTVEVDAADQTSLVVQGNARVAADKAVTRKIELSTAPFPPAGHADRYQVEDPRLGEGAVLQVQGAWWETAWSRGGVLADTKHRWEIL